MSVPPSPSALSPGVQVYNLVCQAMPGPQTSCRYILRSWPSSVCCSLSRMDGPTVSSSLCRKLINSTSAPPAIGPYNQAVMVDRTLYISGQLGMKKTGAMVEGGTLAQAEQALRNIGEILEAAGGGYKDIIKTTVLMKDIKEFTEVNKIYAKFFNHHQPARAAFQVAALPRGGNIEIEAVALIGKYNPASHPTFPTYLLRSC